MDAPGVDGLLEAPLGCAFLLLVERDGLTPEAAVTPHEALARAAIAGDALRPWADRAVERRERAIETGAALRGLAERLLAEPGAAWWSEPFQADRQVWNASGWPRDRINVLPSPEPESWEGYAERPRQWAVTSTLHDGATSLDAVLQYAPGEWDLDRPETAAPRRANVARDARVFEVHGPDDWHALCREYPGRYPETGSPAGEGLLTPRWFAAAEVWDGVHLSFAGLLTTPWVTRESEAGVSRLWSWDVEGTMWLNDGVMLGEAMETDPVADVAPLDLLEGEEPSDGGATAILRPSG